MGMFDTLRSSYDLGAGFTKELQTKDLECCMYHYWIDPLGRLWDINYQGTQDLIINEKAENIWEKVKPVPNGCHGKVSPVFIDKEIEVYPAQWNAHYAALPRRYLTFKGGVLYGVE
jgi:hypothetical protein